MKPVTMALFSLAVLTACNSDQAGSIHTSQPSSSAVPGKGEGDWAMGWNWRPSLRRRVLPNEQPILRFDRAHSGQGPEWDPDVSVCLRQQD